MDLLKPSQPSPSPEKPDKTALLEELLLGQREAFNKAKAREAEEAERSRSKADVETDLPGYLMSKYGYTQDEVGVLVANAIYGLNPDNPAVPVEAKIKLLEVKQQKAAREQQLALERKEAEEKKRASEAARQQALAHFELLGRGLEAESSKYANSAVYYDDPKDYARDMENMAVRLVAAAEARGIDLPDGQGFIDYVQRAVEETVGEKLTRAQQKQAARQAAAGTKEVKTPTTVPGAIGVSVSGGVAKRGAFLTKAEADAEASQIFRKMLNK